MTTIHPTAIVDPGATIGEGTRVWHFVHVCGGATIGARCVLGQNVFVGPEVRLGDGVKVQNNVSIYEGVEIEDEAVLLVTGAVIMLTMTHRPIGAARAAA